MVLSQVYIPELGMSFEVQKGKTRLFACQNPLNQGGGRKGLPKSFLNRFTQVQFLCYSLRFFINWHVNSKASFKFQKYWSPYKRRKRNLRGIISLSLWFCRRSAVKYIIFLFFLRFMLNHFPKQTCCSSQEPSTHR